MKKIYYVLAFFLVLFSCSKDQIIIEDKEEEVLINVPVALDDTYVAVQNQDFLIQGMLDNDTIFEFARISSFDEQTTENGNLESRGNNRYLYTPPSAEFTGTDSFTYTICDNLSPNNCSTATVFINVEEDIANTTKTIILRDDVIFGVKDVSLTIANVFENDFFQGLDVVNIKTLIDDTTNGTVSLSSDNVISYTPNAGFIGTDTFDYEVCTEDSSICETATVSVKIGETTNFNIPANITDYYKDALFYEDGALTLEFLKLFTEKAHTTKLSYIQRHNYLYDADADMNNADNVILIYSGESRYEEEYQGNGNYNPQTFNTEHVYPQSYLDDNETAIADLHLLRVCDASTNTSRSNKPFIEGSGNYLGSSSGWYPGDEWRGDVARIIFYVTTYYEEPISDVGTLETLLRWNLEDPVSAFEEQRNRVIYAAQGNRNPFIDNPYIATLIWGGDAAENKWK
jgi:endonuclease I